jgi:hypothetical protein
MLGSQVQRVTIFIRVSMEPDHATLLMLVKELAEGTLKMRIAMQEMEGRLARIEHVMSNPTYANIASPSQSILYAQRDIIGE